MERQSRKQKAGRVGLLFLLFLKIGLFTFGGGYAMISLIRGEFIEKRKWITSEEFTDMIAISESTPGPLAINSATYVGYKLEGFWGALCATVGVVIPSFVIIFVISLFLEQFLEFRLVAAAFKGIQVAVAFLILTAGVKMFREMDKNPVTLTIAVLTFGALLTLDILSLSFSSVWMILIGAGIGLVAYAAMRIREHRRRDERDHEADIVASDTDKDCDGSESNAERMEENEGEENNLPDQENPEDTCGGQQTEKGENK